MGSKQKDSAKKKGPKGKKARAKAKLERQWGEVAIDDDKTKTKRIGNSRLLAKQKTTIRWGENETKNLPKVTDTEAPKPPSAENKRKEKRVRRRRKHEDDSSSSENSSDEELEDESNVVNQFLSTIQKSIRKKRKAGKRDAMEESEENVDELDDDIMDDEQSEDESSDDEGNSDEDDGKDEDLEGSDEDLEEQNSVSQDDGGGKIDVFSQRFGRSPLSALEMSKEPSSIEKVPLETSLEFLVSNGIGGSDEFADLLIKESNPTEKSNHWQKCAKLALASTRKVLNQNWKKYNKKTFTSRQAPVYAALSTYADMFVTADSIKTREEMHRLYMLHVLNHVLTSRSRIQRHNRHLKEIEETEDADNPSESTEQFRDQGFTRPTVLVLLPTRSTCYQFIQGIFQLTGNEFDNGQNERFDAEYGNPDEEENDETEGEKIARRKAVLQNKGREWNELFGETVNQDDDFKVGVSLTPKAAKGKNEKKKGSNVGIKLYSDFFKSDIIVASPLGLKLLIAPDDEEDKGGDCDYLSSIEICLVQYSDVLMMQNWDHVNDILAFLNQEPQKNNNTDFSRVRNYFLEGQSAHWRQIIFSSKFMDPFLGSTFKRFSKSLSGSIRMWRKTEPDVAAISNVLVPIKQVFQKVPTSTFAKQSEARVNYFVKTVLPEILRHKQKHTLIYVPSYFDFCSLRNVFLKRELSFVSVHEYSRTSEVTRGRAYFLQGRKPIMLYTGRANFFHRHAIKGARHLVFLGLPEHSQFYSDLVNGLSTATDAENDIEALGSPSTCLVLFTKYEAMALERIVGSTNCSRMLKSEKSTFMFYS